MAGKLTPYYGQNRPTSDTGNFNARWFMVDQMIKRISTATLVQVQAITTTSLVAPIGTMSVTPLVHMLDGANNISKHGKVQNIAYCRMQAGKNAVIMDPQVGDIGLAVFCDRDTSVVRKTKKAAAPGSRRRFDKSDGVYVMTVLGDTPTRYVQFRQDGTIIVGNADAGNPFELVVAKDHVQMKHKGDTAMHITIDGQTGIISAGKVIALLPDPYPGD